MPPPGLDGIELLNRGGGSGQYIQKKTRYSGLPFAWLGWVLSEAFLFVSIVDFPHRSIDARTRIRFRAVIRH